jgi:hypothetical protein
MQCARCGTYWDVSDKDRPACKPRSLAREKAMLRIRELVGGYVEPPV